MLIERSTRDAAVRKDTRRENGVRQWLMRAGVVKHRGQAAELITPVGRLPTLTSRRTLVGAGFESPTAGIKPGPHSRVDR